MHGKLNRTGEMVETSDDSSNTHARELDSDARGVLLLFPGKSLALVRKFLQPESSLVRLRLKTPVYQCNLFRWISDK